MLRIGSRADASGLIREIRAYYASPAQKDVVINELVDFDYEGRGYHLAPKA